jgi:hypothetical protein
VTVTPEPPTVTVRRADGISELRVRGLEYRGYDDQGRVHWRGRLCVWPGDKVLIDRAQCVVELPRSGEQREQRVDNDDMSSRGRYDYTTLTDGDRVLVSTSDGLTPQECQTLKDRLSKAFPGVQFTVLAGVQVQVHVEHADEQTPA